MSSNSNSMRNGKTNNSNLCTTTIGAAQLTSSVLNANAASRNTNNRFDVYYYDSECCANKRSMNTYDIRHGTCILPVLLCVCMYATHHTLPMFFHSGVGVNIKNTIYILQRDLSRANE